MKRIAHVWTPERIVHQPIAGDWPQSIVIGQWIYEHDCTAHGEPDVRRGRRTGAEFLEYRQRRLITCADVPAVLEAYGLPPEVNDESTTATERARRAREADRGATERPR